MLYELEQGRRLGWEIEQLADELGAVLGRPVNLGSTAASARTPALGKRARQRFNGGLGAATRTFLALKEYSKNEDRLRSAA